MFTSAAANWLAANPQNASRIGKIVLRMGWFRFKVKIRVLGFKGIRAFKLPEYLFARIGFGKMVCRLLFRFSDDLGLSVTVKR